MAYKPYIIQMIPRCNVEIIKYLLFFRGVSVAALAPIFYAVVLTSKKGHFSHDC